MHDSVGTEKSELTYKSLPENTVLVITSILHVTILLLAIVIPDIEAVFELVGSFACVCIAYVFPAVGYLLALKRYGTEERRNRLKTKVIVVISWTYLVFGVSTICFYLAFILLKLTGVVKKVAL